MTKADQPAQQQQPNIAVSGGTGHTFNIINQGTLAKFSPTVQWYQQEMSRHGLWYWIMHGIVALVVVAIWEYRHWFVGLLR
jgi:hypothetical protein